MPLDLVPSVCPHDCTSTCALEVERLDARTIGRVRGSLRNTYTAGVICEKVARYAERSPPPRPADAAAAARRRQGRRRAVRSAISWDDALDIVAEPFIAQGAPARQRDGVAVLTTPARWGWCSATASTGCATR